MSHAQSAASSIFVMFRWVLATTIGYGAGLLAGWCVTLVAERAGANSDRFLAVAMLICLGVTVGVAQSWVMAPYVGSTRHWVAATFAGYLLALIVFALVGFILSSVGLVDDAALLILAGAAIGLAQWWVLRRPFRSAAIWVVASAVGFTSFVWLVAHPTGSVGALVLMGAILGGVGAIATGAALVWLVRPHSLIAS